MSLKEAATLVACTTLGVVAGVLVVYLAIWVMVVITLP